MKAQTWRSVLALTAIGFLFCVLASGCQTATPPDPNVPGTADDGDQTQDPGTDEPSNDPTSPDDGSNAPAVGTDAASLDEWVQAALDDDDTDNQPPVAPAYSSDLISQAYAAGEISQDQYLLQSVRAAFQPDLLDEEFHGDSDPGTDPTAVLRRLRLEQDSLSPETYAELLPYMLSCDDPDSFHHRPDQPTAEEVFEDMQACGVTRDMDRRTPDGDLWMITGPTGSEEKQDLVREALNYAYIRFRDLGFPEPTDWIRVSLVEELSNPDWLGVEYMAYMIDHYRCHIDLKLTIEDERLMSTTAHELFHCFQDYVDGDGTVEYPEWVWESTAVWSEEFVYPDLNREHEYDSDFFESLNSFFFDISGTLEYSSYMFWFFLYQRDGKSGDVVRDMYFQIHNEGTLPAITGRPDFYNEYKEYALWNLNMSPYKYYADFDNQPTGRPSGYSFANEEVPQGERYYENMWIAEGGIAYYMYTFDDMVDKVTFDMHDIKKTDDNQNGVQIVYRIDGIWVHEDVSARDDFSFCRSRPSEALDAIIFIVSNGNFDLDDPDASLNGEFIIDTTEWCAPTWHGQVECSWNWSGEGDPQGSNRTTGNYTHTGTKRVDETLLYDSEEDRFFATDYTVTYSSSYRWYYEPPKSQFADDIGYTAWEQREFNIDVSKTEMLDIPEECPSSCSGLIGRIYQIDDGDERSYYLKSTNYSRLGEYTSTYSAFYVPGSLGIMQGHAPEVRTSDVTHNKSTSCPPEAFELTMSEDGMTLSGDYVDDNWTCHAEYRFE